MEHGLEFADSQNFGVRCSPAHFLLRLLVDEGLVGLGRGRRRRWVLVFAPTFRFSRHLQFQVVSQRPPLVTEEVP